MTVITDSGRQTRTLQAGSGFLSQHSKEVLFGLGNVKGPIRASIRWPSGNVQELRDLPLNHRVWVEEGSEPTRMEPFKPWQSLSSGQTMGAREIEALPETVETWLLSPLPAPDFSLPDLDGKAQTLSSFGGKLVLLTFWTSDCPSWQEYLNVLSRLREGRDASGLQVLAVNVNQATDEAFRLSMNEHFPTFHILHGSDEVAGIYNILYRQLFDRHRDMTLPTSFLLNGQGEVVKIYQGEVTGEHIEQDIGEIPNTLTERLAKALPFPGVTDVSAFRRNHLEYGSVFFQRGYFDQAAASFEQALRDDATSAEALYGLGSAYLKQQRTKQARETFERATQAHASYSETLPNAWNNLGLLAAKQGDTEEAIRYFKRSLTLSPGHLIALNNLGNAYRQQKQWDEARQVLERAIEVDPEDPEANYSLGMVFAQLNDTGRAYEYLQAALKFRPVYPEALNNLGVLFLRTARRDEAVASFEACIREAPTFDQSYLNLARVYALEDRPDKARGVLQKLLQQHPGHAQAQAMLEQLGR